jgi:hypothetical protein
MSSITKFYAAAIVPELLKLVTQNLQVCEILEAIIDLEAWMKKSLSEVARLTTADGISSMVLRKIRTNMKEKGSIMRINQLVSDYPTLSRKQGCTLVKYQQKQTSNGSSKASTTQTVCENGFLLDHIELRKDF